MNFKRAILGMGASAFLVGGLVGAGGGAALGDASSSTPCWYGPVGYAVGYKHQAYTTNSSGSPYRGGGIQQWSAGMVCAGSNTRSIGNSSYLKKSNGVACVTRNTSYISGTYLNRLSPYSSAACGTGSLAGGGTSYGYNAQNTGYVSASIAAPYQTF